MKKMFIIVLIFIGVLFLNGCTGMSRYNVRIVDENYKIKEEFLKAVEEEVSDRLKGVTPRTGTVPAADPFLNGLNK